MTWVYALDRRIWGGKVEANRYFATLSVLSALVMGACMGGGTVFREWFGWDTAPDAAAMGAALLLVWGWNLAESIVASKTGWIALSRSLLLWLILALAFAFGVVASVVVLFLVAAWVVLTFIGYALSGSGGRSRGGSGGSSSDDDPSIETSSGRRVSGTFAGDDFHGNDGQTYKRTGWGDSDWEKR